MASEEFAIVAVSGIAGDPAAEKDFFRGEFVEQFRGWNV